MGCGRSTSRDSRESALVARPITDLADAIGVPFANPDLLRRALVHLSYRNEAPATAASNERLEYLGDAVLGFIVSDELYRRYPDQTEGELTILRSALVRTETLARLAKDLDLGEWMLLGRGEALAGGRERPRILAGLFEAVIGAIHLDSGLDSARSFVLRQLADDFDAIGDSGPTKDAKSRLQELVQARWQQTPIYHATDRSTSQRDRRFDVDVEANGTVVANGSGRTKQQAEQAAAIAALAILSEAESS